ncbi:LAMI_0G16622g1_1 [Lachancea mirantina]|uniref:LAMI_0G16622g1_1 n=1 Tax=Lachancea mirantina TaxID=1230905 RepID=A0A1G4KCM1_9SACH|nr:LAMI_0G16622g1_1 [Lachancea mirantina]
MSELGSMMSSSDNIIASTKFSVIEKDGCYAVKSTPLDSVVKPHDPICELDILNLLKGKNKHIIEILNSKIVNGIVTMKFPFYEENLYQYMLRNLEKKRWNPYLLESREAKETFVNKLDKQFAVSFFVQLAIALKFIHENGIIHRDVKPQNVLVSQNFEVTSKARIPQLVLIDFGIAYNVNKPQEPLDFKITDVSTSIYKAPELLFSVKNYSFPVDVWALLVLASQMFQSVTQSRTHIPAFADDGTGEIGEGSDIRLIASIFRSLGIPRVQQWPEVQKFGSPAFEGMFGSDGDGKYILDRDADQQRTCCLELFPALESIEEPQKSKLIECFIGMMPFESSKRISSAGIVELLQNVAK